MGWEIPNYCKWSSIAGKTKGNHGNSMKIIYEKNVYSGEKHQTRQGIVQLAMKMIDIGVAFLNPQWLALKYNTDHYGFCLRNVV